MKAVRIELLEPDATFATPTSKADVFSYLMPPPSTIIGMAHKLCRYTSYHPMNVSVFNTESYVNHHFSYEHRWFIGEFANLTEDNKKRWPYIGIRPDGRFEGRTMSPKHIEHVTDLHLIIHIVPEDQEEIEHIYSSFKNPIEYPSLGNHHDLVDIKEVKIVDISEESKIIKFDGLALRKAEHVITFPVESKENEFEFEYIDNNDNKKAIISNTEDEYKYISNLLLFDIETTVYKLHKDYKIVGKFRRFNDHLCMLYNGCRIGDAYFVNEQCDEDGKPVFLI